MFVLCPAGHQDVVEVDENKTKVLADGVHEALEGLGSIFEAERGSQEFVQPKGRYHCHLVDILGRHRDLVVTSDEVHLGENPTTVELSREVLKVGNGVLVFVCCVVEVAEIATRSP